jgi:hypothetical protein
MRLVSNHSRNAFPHVQGDALGDVGIILDGGLASNFCFNSFFMGLNLVCDKNYL